MVPAIPPLKGLGWDVVVVEFSYTPPEGTGLDCRRSGVQSLRKREGEKERERDTHTYLHTYINKYIHTYIYQNIYIYFPGKTLSVCHFRARLSGYCVVLQSATFLSTIEMLEQMSCDTAIAKQLSISVTD